MSPHPLDTRIRASLARSHRWHPAEIAFWVLALAAYFLFPRSFSS